MIASYSPKHGKWSLTEFGVAGVPIEADGFEIVHVGNDATTLGDAVNAAQEDTVNLEAMANLLAAQDSN